MTIKQRPMKQCAGITLIELVVVVTIISILAAIAYPSYRAHVIKSNRAAAQSFMMELSSRQEQILLDRRQYVAAANNEAIGTAIRVSVPPEVSRYYDLSIEVFDETPPRYVINAQPKVGTIQASDSNLMLDSRGMRTPPELWK